eukprot:TRINITY_DN5820_c0_g1_i15.p1 TRINITY_DN5820_c0_g1~~TRINITY_DN5820_c0_g1_i15.p1  ORF type:complete len:279 (-),score=49.01 TRINITY_DN5820_c0_g1_i15:80-874(-)
MSPELREEASTFVVREEVRKNPLFLNLPPGVTRHMLPILDDVAVQQGECIVLQGEIGEFMYIFVTGMGKQRGASNGKTILRRGNSFGEEILLEIEELYLYSVSAMVHSTLCRIGADEFKKAFESMPLVVTQMRRNFITKVPCEASPARDERVIMPDVKADFGSLPPGFADTVLSLLVSIKDALASGTGSRGCGKPVTDVEGDSFNRLEKSRSKVQERTTGQVTQNHMNIVFSEPAVVEENHMNTVSSEPAVVDEVGDCYQKESL